MSDPTIPSREGASRAGLARHPARLAIAAAVAGVVLGGGGMWLLARPGHQHAGAAGGGAAGHPSEPAKKDLYQCPMHPSITSDHPGDCPICGMKLVKVSQGSGGKGERTIAFYRNPMDPKIHSPVPRKDEMGMDYVPVYQDELAGGAAPVQGLAPVTIDPARQQLIGLRTAPVSRGPVGGAWRTVGRVQVDPTRVRKINLKVSGYVERVHVDFVGRRVRRGEPLFTLYSPELLSAQNEYLLALETQRALAAGGDPGGSGETLVTSARRRLELWDVPKSEIDRLERTGQASKTLTFYSPIQGVVTAKNVVEGSRLGPGDAPYEVTDLGEVWVMADAYETDIPRVRVGMSAELTLSAMPNRVFKGMVAFIDPLLDPKTRTVKVHLHFPNPGGELVPEMYGEVVLAAPARDGLRIPFDAVVSSGTSSVVFVALGEGKFQPRQVQLGEKRGELVEVKQGLSEGEEVVIRANFLVDSESRLRASLSALGGK
jgi:Cu(I)/Ag(I) efflux system membrane fusion protein